VQFSQRGVITDFCALTSHELVEGQAFNGRRFPKHERHELKLKRVGAIAFFVIAGHCCANPTLDQSFIPPIRNFVLGGCCSAAQTFSVGIAGTLAQVNLDLYDLRDAFGRGPTLQIVRTVSGAPSDNALDILATVALPTVESPQLLAVDLSSFGIGESVGELLAIEIFGRFDWIAGSGYPGGMAFVGGSGSPSQPLPNLDLGFQTFVPEPNSLALLIVGIFGFAATKRRKQYSTPIGASLIPTGANVPGSGASRTGRAKLWHGWETLCPALVFNRSTA
jgi:hypothetical protein